MNIGSTVGSAFTAGTSGIQAGTEQLNRAASQVAEVTTERAPESVSKVSNGVVSQNQAEIQVKASAQVVDAANQQQKSTIDITV